MTYNITYRTSRYKTRLEPNYVNYRIALNLDTSMKLNFVNKFETNIK